MQKLIPFLKLFGLVTFVFGVALLLFDRPEGVPFCFIGGCAVVLGICMEPPER